VQNESPSLIGGQPRDETGKIEIVGKSTGSYASTWTARANSRG